MKTCWPVLVLLVLVYLLLLKVKMSPNTVFAYNLHNLYPVQTVAEILCEMNPGK